MSSMEMLAFVRGPGFAFAIFVFLFGSSVRLLEMFLLGRKKDLSEAREPHSSKYGWRTIVTRTFPTMVGKNEAPIAMIIGYIFHIGLFIIVFFYVPHILLIRELIGLEWSGLPFWIIDGLTLITMAAMVMVLWIRVWNKVRRYLSRFSDYYAWTVTFLPVLTGYLAFHRLFLPYNDMLIVHILTVELLLISLPFTKLFHTFSLFFARWYNGEAAGRKGVKV